MKKTLKDHHLKKGLPSAKWDLEINLRKKYQHLFFFDPSSNLLATLKLYFSVSFQFTYHLLFSLAPLLPSWYLSPLCFGLLWNDLLAPSILCSILFSHFALSILMSVMFSGHIRHAPALVHSSFLFCFLCLTCFHLRYMHTLLSFVFWSLIKYQFPSPQKTYLPIIIQN